MCGVLVLCHLALTFPDDRPTFLAHRQCFPEGQCEHVIAGFGATVVGKVWGEQGQQALSHTLRAPLLDASPQHFISFFIMGSVYCFLLGSIWVSSRLCWGC